MINIKNKILAVIVTYNRISLLKECIIALQNSSVKCDVLIVNNNSSDGTKEYLLELNNLNQDNKYIIINSEINLNGAGGYNLGIKKALEYDYDYIWLMDDDCIVNKDTLKELLNVRNKLNDDFGFLSSKVLWKDGSICKTNVQRRAVARKINDFDSEIVNVDYCSFVSCFVKTKDIKNIGLPLKEFIIWTDDLEWTRRLTDNRVYENAKTGYLCNKSIVIHKCKENIGVSIVYDNTRIDRYKYIYRNDVVCFRREGIKGHLYMLIRNIYHIIKVLLFADNKFKKISIIINGYIEGYKFNPTIEYIK